MEVFLRKKAKRLVIVGCGGFGRETLDWALQAQSNAAAAEYDDICMVDKKTRLCGFPTAPASL